MKLLLQGSHRSGKILKTFSNRGKMGFSAKIRGKKFQIRELFSQTIFKPSNLRKMFLRLLNLRSCQEIALNGAIFA